MICDQWRDKKLGLPSFSIRQLVAWFRAIGSTPHWHRSSTMLDSTTASSRWHRRTSKSGSQCGSWRTSAWWRKSWRRPPCHWCSVSPTSTSLLSTCATRSKKSNSTDIGARFCSADALIFYLIRLNWFGRSLLLWFWLFVVCCACRPDGS